MKLPQIIFLAILMLGLGVDMERHGQEKTGKYNFWTSVVSFGIIIGILYWGGFFN
jgi:hypothetical protein